MTVEQEQPRIVSCSGSKRAGNDLNHIFMVEGSGGKVIGFLTRQEFEEGAENGTLPGKIAITDHDTCPDCLASQLGESLDGLKKRVPDASGAVVLYQSFLDSHS